jgi:hypothetical protein
LRGLLAGARQVDGVPSRLEQASDGGRCEDIGVREKDLHGLWKRPAVARSSGAKHVEAISELYFTVNGVELRPANGGTFGVRYQNYLSSYALCVR